MKDFIIKMFAIDVNDYFHTFPELKINRVLLVLIPIFMLLCVMIHCFRRNIYFTVKQLTRHGATDEKTAKSLHTIGLGGNFIVKYMLRGDSQLSKVVRRVGAVTYTYDEYVQLEKEKKLPKGKINFDEAKFYLDTTDEKRIGKIIERYDIPISKTVIAVLFVLVIMVLIMLLMPEILTLIGKIIEFVGGLY